MKTLDYRLAREQFDSCPFCGCNVNVFEQRHPTLKALGWVVECKNMGCIFRRSSPNLSLSMLRREWNTRV